MLYTIGVILLVLWLLGLVSGYTLGRYSSPPGHRPHCGGDPGYSGPKAAVRI